MKKLINCAEHFIMQSDWKDIAILKFCLLSIGILIGVSIPKKEKKAAVIAASTLFAVTYPPLMSKFLKLLIAEHSE